jgi:hypothetical protein
MEPESTPESGLIMPVDFTKGNITYRYDFSLLTAEQGEFVREVGEYKANTIENPPTTLNAFIKSEAIDYVFLAMSYLAVEVKEDIPQDFNRSLAEKKAQPFFKSLPMSETLRMRACIMDFFQRIQESSTGSLILQGRKKESAIEMLFPYLIQMVAMQNDNTLSPSLNETPSGMTENSLEG